MGVLKEYSITINSWFSFPFKVSYPHYPTSWFVSLHFTKGMWIFFGGSNNGSVFVSFSLVFGITLNIICCEAYVIISIYIQTFNHLLYIWNVTCHLYLNLQNKNHMNFIKLSKRMEKNRCILPISTTKYKFKTGRYLYLCLCGTTWWMNPEVFFLSHVSQNEYWRSC